MNKIEYPTEKIKNAAKKNKKQNKKKKHKK